MKNKSHLIEKGLAVIAFTSIAIVIAMIIYHTLNLSFERKTPSPLGYFK